MSIPASKVKAVCTDSEIALVRASRRPAIQELSAAELKRLGARARKLFDKWQGLGRGQSRERQRKTGSSELSQNTQLKTQIFREALESFEAQLAKIGPAVGAAKPAPAKTKAVRSRGHRADRAAVRKDMALVEELLNAGARKRKRATAASAASKPRSRK